MSNDKVTKLCSRILSDNDQKDLVLDDESYFSRTGSSYPENSGFYTTNPEQTPAHIKHREIWM